MIYVFDNLGTLDERNMEEAIKLLPGYRQEKLRRYRNEIDRKLCLCAYLLLVAGLKNEHKILNVPDFDYTKTGKPYFKHMPDMHFNMSHCRKGVACVLSEVCVGIDIQDFIEIDDSLIKRVMTPREIDVIGRSENPEYLFCRYWTMKEAYLKYTGQGISEALTEIDTDSIMERFKDRIYFSGNEKYCLCSIGAMDSGHICIGSFRELLDWV